MTSPVKGSSLRKKLKATGTVVSTRHNTVINTAASPADDDPRPIQVRDIYLHKVRGHPYWPVQVCRVEEDTVSLVYYETGETNVVPKSSADLVPFTQQTIEKLKLDQ